MDTGCQGKEFLHDVKNLYTCILNMNTIQNSDGLQEINLTSRLGGH